MSRPQSHRGSSDQDGSPTDAKKPADDPQAQGGGDLMDRLEHFTWANYTFSMSTGGLALLLSEKTQAFNFTGLQTIGKVVYIFDLVIFTAITLIMIARFVRFPGTLKSSLMHPTEGLFLATAQLSLASIFAGIARYGIPECGPWLVVVFRVLFWIYFAVGFLIAVGQYTLLFTSPRLKEADMTPAWDLPIFPFMLSGTIASAGAGHQPPEHALPIIVAGLTAQGLGMLISLCMYACYCRRMIEFGFPRPGARPAMFIAVGPPAFTSLAIIGMAENFPKAYRYWGASDVTVQILEVMAIMTSIFIWSLSFWFFCIAVVACLQVRKHLTFQLNWWAFVFPNVGFTISVLSIGKSLESPGVKWVGTIMSILIVCVWLFVFYHYVRAILQKAIWAVGRDEDVYHDSTDHKWSKAARIKRAADTEKQA